MTRIVLGIKGPPTYWHIVPNDSWRDAWYFGKRPVFMPCGATGIYAGRLEYGQILGHWRAFPSEWCIDCLYMEATGDWPPDPVWQLAGT